MSEIRCTYKCLVGYSGMDGISRETGSDVDWRRVLSVVMSVVMGWGGVGCMWGMGGSACVCVRACVHACREAGLLYFTQRNDSHQRVNAVTQRLNAMTQRLNATQFTKFTMWWWSDIPDIYQSMVSQHTAYQGGGTPFRVRRVLGWGRWAVSVFQS